MSRSFRSRLAATCAVIVPCAAIAAGPPAPDAAAAGAPPAASAAAPPAESAGATPVASAAGGATPGATPRQLDKVEVIGTRQRLDAARNGLSPETGSTVYRFDRQDLADLPLGESTPLNQVLLRAPGVVQDSYGQLHVRGDHGNVQYRLNGVVIPKAISGFGQSLETRFADSVSVLTGALPAQYGYRTAAVVDIRTRGEGLPNGGSVGVVGGSRGHAESSVELHGTQGAFSYALTGSLLRDDVGIENPTPARDAIHDTTHQAKGYAYLSYLLGADSRVGVLFGDADNRFQIPNLRGETPVYTLAGVPFVDSAALDARQRERNRFGVVTLQGAAGADAAVDYQVSLFSRTTDLRYRPDPVGDLVFGGVAADIARRNVASGVQADFSVRLGAAHTLRTGLFAQRERYDVSNASTVFPAYADGRQTSDVPLRVEDRSRIDGHLWGVYVQDEWQASKALTVNYGVRFDQVKTVVDERQASPRLGAVYEASQDLRLHAGYARYFTPPPTEKIDTTSIRRFLGTTNALPGDANTAVRSERSDVVDAGFAYQATPRLTLGVDAYHRRVRHLQDEGQFGNALVYSAFNYARARVSGIDVSASWRDRGLSGYVNLGYARARARTIESGQFNFDAAELAVIDTGWVHLDHEQRLTASAGVAYRRPDGLTLAADALYGSGMRNGPANTTHLPGYTQVNLAATRGVDLGAGLGKLDLRVSLLNAFDRVYELRDGSGIGVGAPQFGPRRTWFAGVAKRY